MRKILLQTTIPFAENDWHIGRFSILTQLLAETRDRSGKALYQVVTRDRENLNGDDRVLAGLDSSDYDQLWLFGVDVGGGLSANDCAGINRFHARGGSLSTSRDHQDLGISFCLLGDIGIAHHFHTNNPEKDLARCCNDDTETATISWPNYHSGKNGDYQRVFVTQPVHPIMQSTRNSSGAIELLPAHPHEGAVSASGDSSGTVVATGKSTITDRSFNLAIAFERVDGQGRAIADSSFHHFLDYNLDPRRGCPTFVTEPVGHGIAENPQALTDAGDYFRNLAAWLS